MVLADGKQRAFTHQSINQFILSTLVYKLICTSNNEGRRKESKALS